MLGREVVSRLLEKGYTVRGHESLAPARHDQRGMGAGAPADCGIDATQPRCTGRSPSCNWNHGTFLGPLVASRSAVNGDHTLSGTPLAIQAALVESSACSTR